MEPECPLPHSQMPATCPYPEQAWSLPCPHIHSLKINHNIILPSTPVSPNCRLSLRFPHQNPVYAFPLPHTRYMHSPSHSSRFYHPHKIVWGVQIIEVEAYAFQFSKIMSTSLNGGTNLWGWTSTGEITILEHEIMNKTSSQNKQLHTPRMTDHRHNRQDIRIQTELAFTLAKNAT